VILPRVQRRGKQVLAHRVARWRRRRTRANPGPNAANVPASADRETDEEEEEEQHERNDDAPTRVDLAASTAAHAESLGGTAVRRRGALLVPTDDGPMGKDDDRQADDDDENAWLALVAEEGRLPAYTTTSVRTCTQAHTRTVRGDATTTRCPEALSLSLPVGGRVRAMPKCACVRGCVWDAGLS
jgi:hypothetical protein